jgi:hypothetical protein
MDIGVPFPDDQRVRRLLDCWNARLVALLSKQFVRNDFGKEADEIAQSRVHRAAPHFVNDKNSPHSVDCRGAVSKKPACEPAEGEWPLVMANGLEGYSAKVAAAKSLFTGLLFVPLAALGTPNCCDYDFWINIAIFATNVMTSCRDEFR